MPEQQQSDRGFAGTLKSKWGPLPVWGWLLLVTILGLGYYLWTRRQGAQQTTAPVTGQPGVVVINQGQQPPSTTPPKPPEDHDKDEDGEPKGHDDDDHHRHRRHKHDIDAGQPPPPSPKPPIPLPPIGNPPPTPSVPSSSVNVGRLFPKITPATGSGGTSRKRG